MTDTARRWGIAPYLIVDDVVRTANDYRDRLGFSYDRLWGDPPRFCMVWRRGVVIMLSQLEAPGAMRPNRTLDPQGGAWDAYIWVDDADALYAEFQAAGVKIVRPSAIDTMAAATSTSRIATGIASASAWIWREPKRPANLCRLPPYHRSCAHD